MQSWGNFTFTLFESLSFDWPRWKFENDFSVLPRSRIRSQLNSAWSDFPSSSSASKSTSSTSSSSSRTCDVYNRACSNILVHIPTFPFLTWSLLFSSLLIISSSAAAMLNWKWHTWSEQGRLWDMQRVPGDPFYNILNHFASRIRLRERAVFHRPRIENTPEHQNWNSFKDTVKINVEVFFSYQMKYFGFRSHHKVSFAKRLSTLFTFCSVKSIRKSENKLFMWCFYYFIDLNLTFAQLMRFIRRLPKIACFLRLLILQNPSLIQEKGEEDYF